MAGQIAVMRTLLRALLAARIPTGMWRKSGHWFGIGLLAAPAGIEFGCFIFG